MSKRTNSESDNELRAQFPWLNGDWSFLLKAMRRMAAFGSVAERRVQAFKLYYGLEGAPPKTYAEIGNELLCTGSYARDMCLIIGRRLKHPQWRDESRWPEPPPPRTATSRMKPRRIEEIAMLLQMWRFQQLGTRNYIGELVAAAEEIGVSEEDMREFYNAVADRLMRRA